MLFGVFLRMVLELHDFAFLGLSLVDYNHPEKSHLPRESSVSRILISAPGFGRQIGPIGCVGDKLFEIYLSGPPIRSTPYCPNDPGL